MPSSVVAHISYDEARSVLRVRFVSGAVYDYKKVPEKVFLALKHSGSKGTYLNTHIKGTYKFQKIS